MALITTLSTLKSALADFVNRSDITTSSGGQWEVLIQLAEQRFQRDPRIREPGSNNAVLVSLMTTDPNWLLTAEPDIYLYGTLVECAPFLKDDERVPIWEQRYQDAVENLSGSVRLNPARSLALTSYAELQTLAADAVNRGDIKNVVPVAIKLAESRLSNDPRVRYLTSTTYSITADDLAIPTGMQRVESWYHDSTTWTGPIETVAAEQLSTYKTIYGTSGPPKFAANLNGTFRFAPAPDTTYSTKMVYWQTITALASGVNWLYTYHPHIYLFATMVELQPWLHNDPQVAMWEQRLQGFLDDLDLQTSNKQFSGTMRRSFNAIG